MLYRKGDAHLKLVSIPSKARLARASLMASSNTCCGGSSLVRVLGDRCVRDPQGTLTLDYQATIVFGVRALSGSEPSACNLRVKMDGGFSHFDALVDGAHQSTVCTGGGLATYTFALPGVATYRGLSGNRGGETFHTVSLVKRTEAALAQLLPPLQVCPPRIQTHAAVLHSLTTSPGYEICALPNIARRKIEFVGDSDTAAFGCEGAATIMGLRSMLGMRLAHQNISNSWSYALCRMLDAEPSVVAWSGIGVAQNASYCDPPGRGAMAAVFGRAIASDPTSEHRFGSWEPDLGVVQVGGNDLYGGKSAPSPEAFTQVRELTEAVEEC